ncbi:L,D-transpeptidase family protein [Microvirga arsenatis]|uniref:L,D-transpeptidase family protein n=1 Tax=Microvirga arsenatis TaxID=2692265 RepID=A0ABW9YTF0_9HYPH|nr:L,D-transpeptidase family protein [Microvirga arsenatis]NBJ12402.1 L,D-transpeptidase family protein [Microvirga arsenatis]NBJ23278.1 L,D-transpeptidase family protein [Microvirga arsenatis]
MLSRRTLLTGSLALVFTPATGALAQQFAQTQAEWSQNYEAVSRTRVQRTSTPMISADSLAATEQMIEYYRAIAARGGWQPVQGVQGLRVGSKSPAVVALRQRLIVTGDLDPAAGESPIFDSYVEAAVRRFQARHGISSTGTMTGPTVVAMNVPVEMRIRQLEINVARLRSLVGGGLPNRYVVANIPAALVETVEGGVVHTRHAAGVGKIDRQSPLLNSKVVEVNFNPFWTAPASVVKKDLIPKMQKEPNYLAENRIRIFNAAGQEVPSSQINWFSDEATRYRFRQDPGGDLNSMGFVRINIPNQHGVYMHDTPSKGIFGDDFRFVSSGCIRVQNVRDYIEWLLKDTPGWTREQIDATFKSGERIDARLAQPVPIYWVYVTAWATPDGLVQFRDDIYNKDGLGNAIPVASRVPTEPDEEMFLQN